MMAEMRAIAAAEKLPVQFLGMRPRSEVLEIIGRADLQVVCSEWFEGFPLVIVEAYARGTPVIASRIGSLEEIVEDGETGFHFPPGDRPHSWTACAGFGTSPTLRQRLRAGARARFEASYTPEANLQSLLAIYRQLVPDLALGLPPRATGYGPAGRPAQGAAGAQLLPLGHAGRRGQRLPPGARDARGGGRRGRLPTRRATTT